jgi:hypothetical protein
VVVVVVTVVVVVVLCRRRQILSLSLTIRLVPNEMPPRNHRKSRRTADRRAMDSLATSATPAAAAAAAVGAPASQPPDHHQKQQRRQRRSYGAGTRVYKLFDGGNWLWGQVVEVVSCDRGEEENCGPNRTNSLDPAPSSAARRKCYRIVYENGSREDAPRSEVRALAKNGKGLKPSPQVALSLEMRVRSYEVQKKLVSEVVGAGEGAAKAKRTGRCSRAAPTEPGSNRATKRIKLCCYDWLDDDSRVHILKYLAPADLSEACLVSGQFRRDCCHPSLPAMAKQETLVLHESFGTRRGRWVDIGHLRRLVSGLARKASFGRSVTSLKIVWSSSNDGLSEVPEGQAEPLRKGFVVKGVSSLILLTDCCEEAVELAVNVLVPLFPDLRQLDCSPDSVPESKYWTGVFDRVGHLFHSLTRRRGRLLYGGAQLNRFKNVTNVYLDDSLFHYDPTQSSEGARRGMDIFRDCGLTLERVSVKNVQYQSGQVGRIRALPQRGLIEFVRSAPSLKWFRSDLTPQNVAMLQQERPDVTFVS